MFRGSGNIVSFLILVATVVGAVFANIHLGEAGMFGTLVVGFLISGMPRMLNEWDRGVLLRLGKFKKILSPGVTWVVPGIDQIVARVDMRVRSTHFSAERTLTRDTVPINVDAVLFWEVIDSKKSIIEVEDYLQTVSWAAQTTLRDVIGQTELGQLISDRENLDLQLQKTIDAKTKAWGVTVNSVEIRDIIIPGALEDAMSRKAQAEREKDARIILANAELRVAEEMQAAAATYQSDPVAMQLRAMNMTYESIKERGALMVIPSGMNASMDPGVIGMAAAGFRLQPEAAPTKSKT